MQVRRRKRKKVPFADRRPPVLPEVANQVWSMDFMSDHTAEGRVIKCPTVVDDATYESITVVAERTIGGYPPPRMLDRLGLERGLPQVIRTDKCACRHSGVAPGVQRRRAPKEWFGWADAPTYVEQLAEKSAKLIPGL